MFQIQGRQNPVFALSTVRVLAQIAEQVFDVNKIQMKHLNKFDLSSGGRIDQFNSQILIPSNDAWELNVDGYNKYLRKLDIIKSVQQSMQALFGTDVKVVDPDKISDDVKENVSHTQALYDLTKKPEMVDKIPPGDFFCVMDSSNFDGNVECFTGFDAHIFVEHELNEYHIYKSGTNLVIGLIKV